VALLGNDYKFTLDIPEDTKCGAPGGYLYTVDVEGGTSYTDTGILNIEPRGGMTPHKGKYMYVGLNTDKDQIHHFFLSNEDYASKDPGPPGIIMTEFNDRLARPDTYDIASGELISKTGVWLTKSMALEEIVDNCKDGENGGCGVDNTEFGPNYDPEFSDQHGFSYLRDTMTPIHYKGDYKLDGDIITGYQPGYYGEDDYNPPDGPKFFICREGATMSNGYEEDVPQIVRYSVSSGDSFRYRCVETDSGYKWRMASTCDDGLDNNGDGKIDHADSYYQQDDSEQGREEYSKGIDPNCNSPDDDSESTGGCTNGKAIKEDGEWKAWYPAKGGGCTTTPYTDWNVQKPQLDYCTEKNSSEVCMNADYSRYDRMPAVKYYANQSHFQKLAQAQEVDPSNGVNTKFVDDDGWTSQWQTLYRAEKKYSGIGNDPHALSTWNETIGLKMPEVATAYDNDDSSTNIKAWNTANAGVSNSEIRTPDQPSSHQEIFPGGFAGKCSGGQMWQYEKDKYAWDGWMCSGDIPWEQPVMMPKTDGDFIGILVPHTNLMTQDEFFGSSKWTLFNSFPQSVSQADNADAFGSLEEFSASCWAGSLSKDPSNLDGSKVISGTTNVDSNNPFGIYGEVDMGSSNEYSCNWNYTTDTGKTLTNVGTVVSMQKSDNRLESENPDFLSWKKEHVKNINGLQTSYSSISGFEEKTSGWSNLVEVQ